MTLDKSNTLICHCIGWYAAIGLQFAPQGITICFAAEPTSRDELERHVTAADWRSLTGSRLRVETLVESNIIIIITVVIILSLVQFWFSSMQTLPAESFGSRYISFCITAWMTVCTFTFVCLHGVCSFIVFVGIVLCFRWHGNVRGGRM